MERCVSTQTGGAYAYITTPMHAPSVVSQCSPPTKILLAAFFLLGA